MVNRNITGEALFKRLNQIEYALRCIRCTGSGSGVSIVDIGADNNGDPLQTGTIQFNNNGDVFLVSGTGEVIPLGGGGAGTDEIVEVANFAALPITGAANTVYLTLDNNRLYRWSGSVYVEISGMGSVDAVPTNGSLNAVSSDGVFDALVLKQGSLSGTGFVKIAGTTVSYDNSTYATVGSLTSGLATKQDVLNGTGLIRMSGTTLSYDNTVYQAALTNPVTGTGVSTRLALWSGTTSQTSDANATYTSVGGLNLQSSATASTVLRAGAMEFTSYATNNSFMMENMYYDITTPSYKLRNNGFGGLFQFSNGGFIYSGVASGTAGSAVSPTALLTVDGPGGTFGRVTLANLAGTGTRNVLVQSDGSFIAGAESGVVTSRSVAANATLLTSDNILRVDASAGPITITFPASVSVGKSFRIKKTDLTTNAITFAGGTVDDDAAFQVNQPKASVILYASGSTAYDLF